MSNGSAGQQRNTGFINLLLHFRALFVKMFLMSIRKRGQTIAEILLAYTFMGLLLGMRHFLDRRYLEEYQLPPFGPFDAMLLNGSLTNVTYYYPRKFCILIVVSPLHLSAFRLSTHAQQILAHQRSSKKRWQHYRPLGLDIPALVCKPFSSTCEFFNPPRLQSALFSQILRIENVVHPATKMFQYVLSQIF